MCNTNFIFVSIYRPRCVRVGRASIRVLRVSPVNRAVFGRVLIFLALLAGCGRNQRMDTLYVERCINCHGPSGRGDGALAASLPIRPPDFRETVQRKSNNQIRRAIADGWGLMPAFEPALSPSEITDMLQMVRLLSREGRDLAWWERYDFLVAAHCNIPWETVLGYDDPPDGKP